MPTKQPRLLKLPNGVAIDPLVMAAQKRVNPRAVLAAGVLAHKARTPAEAQELVGHVERRFGLRRGKLQEIAAGKLPVVREGGGQLRGIGWGWDDIVDVGKSAAGTFIDATTAVATGGGSLFLPDSLKPGEIVRDPGSFTTAVKEEAAPAVFDGGKWLLKLPVKVLGAAAGAYNDPPPQPPTVLQQASDFSASVAKSLGVKPSSVPWIIGGGVAALLGIVLLTRKKEKAA